MAYGLSNSHLTDDVTCETVRLAILATAWLLVLLRNAKSGKVRHYLDKCAGTLYLYHYIKQATTGLVNVV